MRLDLVTILVTDYDEAIEFFVSALGFVLTEDSPAVTGSGAPKRWVVVRPPAGGTGVLLARAEGTGQQSQIGQQVGGRVGLFLRVENFQARHRAMLAAGVRFLGEIRHEPYGSVVVFQDIAGNRWDLLGPPPTASLIP